MRVLVTLVVVAAVVSAAPKKPTKSFPKKYDATIHNGKDTYSTYPHHANDEDLVLPEFSLFKTILPPIPIPGQSTYTQIGDMIAKESLTPPAEDTYSRFSGERQYALYPPPASSHTERPSSYLTFEGPAEERLKAPELSSYDHVSKDASGTEVLASLARMIQALPSISSYANYQSGGSHDGLVRHMVPPPALSSSYTSMSRESSRPVSVSKTPAVPLSPALAPPPLPQ